MRITHVVRADDLLASTARQILLMRLLGYAEAEIPRYAHVPLVIDESGDRLAKRRRATTVRELAARGVSADELVGALAHGLGLVEEREGGRRAMSAAEVAAALNPTSKWRRTPWPTPGAWQ
jgi:glutamyl-tRNA synthetase